MKKFRRSNILVLYIPLYRVRLPSRWTFIVEVFYLTTFRTFLSLKFKGSDQFGTWKYLGNDLKLYLKCVYLLNGQNLYLLALFKIHMA